MPVLYFITLFGLDFLFGCNGIPPRGPFPADRDFQEAEKYYLAGDFLQARSKYESFIKNNPQSSHRGEARYRLGRSYFAEGDYEKALETFKTALAETPYPFIKAQIMDSIAYVYIYKKDYLGAIHYYKKALATAPEELNCDEIFFNLGTALMRTGNWKEGAQYFQQLIKEYPHSRLTELAQERLSLAPNTFVVQLGKYRNKGNALKEMEELKNGKEIMVLLKQMLIDGEEFWFIWAGSFSSWTAARKAADEIQEKGVDAIVVP
jgi:tetratricopeptide (TPR) repeat protein